MENRFFPNIKNRFGFGMMRLPMNGEEVDYEQTEKMVDEFMAAGFNYFDTAHVYIKGQSEKALKKCLCSRYPRESYVLTNKLTDVCFTTKEDIRRVFEEQLEACGVEYFDFYLMHALGERRLVHYEAEDAFEIAKELKAEGKIRHIGMSFHDGADALELILSRHPEIEVVQIQLNYLDYLNPAIEGQRLVEICEKYGKPMIVMEPVKGGQLVNLPEDAQKVYTELNEKNGTQFSNASYAIRYTQGFENVMMTLSGMSSIEQMRDNLSYMTENPPLTEEEYEAIEKVRVIMSEQKIVPCTGCHYCVTENACPMNILIPEVIRSYNTRKLFEDWNQNRYYNAVLTKENGKASDCIECGMCEAVCPQQLEIRSVLKDVAEIFEK